MRHVAIGVVLGLTVVSTALAYDGRALKADLRERMRFLFLLSRPRQEDGSSSTKAGTERQQNMRSRSTTE